MDIGYEDDWGNVQCCLPGDCEDWKTAVGWGNDVDGHTKIVSVREVANGRVWPPRIWAVRCVWCWVQRYGGG